MSKNLPPLKEFILPGGSEFNARLHILRTTARNTERCLVAMHEDEGRNILHLKYLNRLSDYLFLLARAVGLSEDIEEEHWELNK
jgi:cob(I)alamin adenosyltransferase